MQKHQMMPNLSAMLRSLAAITPHGLWHGVRLECCCLPWVFGFEPIEKSVLVEGSGGSTVAVVSLDVGDSVRVFHHLDETSFVPGWQASIGQHSGAQQININRYYLFRFFSHRISFSLKKIKIYIYIFIYIYTQTNSYYIYKKVYIYLRVCERESFYTYTIYIHI